MEKLMSGCDAVLESYLNSMEENLKTDPETYAERIALCGSCGQLSGGVCRMCGCFVRARAAKRGMSCPLAVPKWSAQPSSAGA